MKAKRREAIKAVVAQLGDITSIIETLMAEEQEYLEAMPEALANGEKGEAAQTAIERLEEARDAVEAGRSHLPASPSPPHSSPSSQSSGASHDTNQRH